MPARSTSPHPSALGRYAAKGLDYAVHYSIELLLIGLIMYMCISRGLNFDVNIYDPDTTEQVGALSEAGLGGWLMVFGDQSRAILTSLHSEVPAEATSTSVSELTSAPAIASNFAGFNEVVKTNDPAPHISNLTLVLSPDYGERKGLPQHIITAKKQRVQNYLNTYAPIARREMRDYGIPASITLAQGLLESNAGDSKLAVNSNNHFGIKCRSKCLGCTCRNYGDDTRYDMFRVFTSVAESFREHSELLNTSRYAKLKKYGKDYKKWAHGLKSCGYATDKRYGHKLVTIIENLGLDEYDG